jgi:excisionase family DNA binding protein
MSPTQLAKELGVSRMTIYRMIHEGKIHGIKIGNLIRFSDEEVSRIKREGTK